MTYQLRIKKPRVWTKNYLKDELLKKGLDRASFNEVLNPNIEVLVTNYLSDDELNSLSKLKVVIIPTAGVENICIKSLLEGGIKVIHDPRISSRGVGMYTLDNLKKLNAFTKKKISVLILGNGNVALEVYGHLKGLVGNFSFFGRRDNDLINERTVFSEEDLLRLLKKSDIIINTLPRSPEVVKLLYDKTSYFKEGSIVVNVSRSDILNDKEIAGRILSGSLRGFITDVSPELMNCDFDSKIIVTPHIAGIYNSSLSEIASFIIKNLQEHSKLKLSSYNN
jgi:phosphoglycerate dehydrogenase-like enzyme